MFLSFGLPCHVLSSLKVHQKLVASWLYNVLFSNAIIFFTWKVKALSNSKTGSYTRNNLSNIPDMLSVRVWLYIHYFKTNMRSWMLSFFFFQVLSDLFASVIVQRLYQTSLDQTSLMRQDSQNFQR